MMEINNIGNTTLLTGTRQAADSIPVPSAPATSIQPVIAKAVQAIEKTEKATTGKQAADPQAAETDIAQVKQSLDTLTRTSGLEFSVDDELGQIVVKVLDPETREVLKQFPTEDALALARSLHGGNGMLHQAEA